MFEQLIAELQARGGLSEKAIADRIGVSQPTVNRIKRGNQKPSFDAGTKLIQLRDEVLGTKQAAA